MGAQLGKTHWTQAQLNYLRHFTLLDAAHNRVLQDNLTTVDFHVERIAKLEEAMLQLLPRLAAQTPRRRHDKLLKASNSSLPWSPSALQSGMRTHQPTSAFDRRSGLGKVPAA